MSAPRPTKARAPDATVRRHRARGPAHDVETSPWRYPLANRGFDPCKKG